MPLPPSKRPGPRILHEQRPNLHNSGWWSLENINGTRDGVLKMIAASALPDFWKAAIKSEIDSQPAEFNYVKVNGHFHKHKDGAIDLTLGIIPSVAVI